MLYSLLIGVCHTTTRDLFTFLLKNIIRILRSLISFTHVVYSMESNTILYFTIEDSLSSGLVNERPRVYKSNQKWHFMYSMVTPERLTELSERYKVWIIRADKMSVIEVFVSLGGSKPFACSDLTNFFNALSCRKFVNEGPLTNVR